jgi:autotransporter strand-loop-strand O-heptosyltransferase
MAHLEQKNFCLRIKEKLPHFFKNKKVLDIGSLDINGNNKELFENCEYIGLDVAEGKNVDTVNIGHLYDAPDCTFDVIISTEVFEHDMFYEKTIQNIMRMLKDGGLFIFTCASTGRPEHGTRRCGQDCAPLLISISEKWADYYKNLESKDIQCIEGFRENFPDGYFEFNNIYCEIPVDLYFYGIKGGQDKFKCDEIPVIKYNEFNNDIFVIDSWTDTLDKKQTLVDLIKKIKVYNIPILLVTHYAVETEIQNLVDYYIFDKKNPILKLEDYNKFNIYSGFWAETSDYKLNIDCPFHHDYACWKSLQNAFNFCKYLGKQNIHFLEYDNFPDELQYRQCFLERINNFDAIIYEYFKSDIEMCSTFIFSIKTEIANKIFNSINSLEEYFSNRTNGWQFERVFIEKLKIFTSRIFITDYVDNDHNLNKQAVWNRDGIVRNKQYISMYDACDINNNFYVVLIGSFARKKNNSNCLIEIVYGNNKQFYNLVPDEYAFINLGVYQKGQTLRCYINGSKVYENFLSKSAIDYIKTNKLVVQKENQNNININWFNGPKVEIVGNYFASYNVKFIDNDSNICLYESNINNNCWTQCSIKYYVNWRIEVTCNGDTKIYFLDLNDKNVLIDFQSSSLGDTIAWIESVNQFQIKHNCKVTCKIFIKDLFEKQYPNIKFIYPGDIFENIDIIYELGIFYNKEKQICFTKNKKNPLTLSLGRISDDILQVNSELIIPKIQIPEKNKSSKKYVCIATQSTSQCKYWNNKDGWFKVVEYLKMLGYNVLCIDKEKVFGVENYFNCMPENCIDKTGSLSIHERIDQINNCDFFIGLSSGLSWLAWACKKPVIMISGFTDSWNEFYSPYRVINKNVCNSCWNDPSIKFNSGNWLWCPRDKNFECSKEITFEQVKEKIDQCIKDLNTIS